MNYALKYILMWRGAGIGFCEPDSLNSLAAVQRSSPLNLDVAEGWDIVFKILHLVGLSVTDI